MTIDAVEHQRLIRPAPLVEQLAQFATFLPIGRTHVGDTDDISGTPAPVLDLGQYPLLQFRQRFDLILKVSPQRGEGARYRMTVGIDHARHQHLAGQVDTLRVGIGQRIDLRISAHLHNLAILDRHRLHQRLAGLGGVHLAVDQHEVSGGHGLPGRKGQGRGQQVGDHSLHRNALLFLSALGTPYSAQQKNGPLQMRRVRRFFPPPVLPNARPSPAPPCS
ncbi:hypothetical protein D3C79_759870 [compost metagenome]